VAALPSSASSTALAVARREWALVRLSARVQRRGWLSRTGRLYAWSVAVSMGALLAWAVSAGDAEDAAVLLRAALGPMSWSAGLVAVACARDLTKEERAGALGLAALSGADGASFGRARVAATMWVVARSLLVPALVLAAFAAFACRGTGASLPVLSFCLRSIVYAALLGGILGALSRGAALVSPQHGRAVFLAVVLFPYALASFGEEVPNVVSGIAWLLSNGFEGLA